jgi:hypothetical protein
VFALDELFAPILPEAWVVGTFNSTCGHGDIESDLRALLVERIQNGLITEQGESA